MKQFPFNYVLAYKVMRFTYANNDLRYFFVLVFKWSVPVERSVGCSDTALSKEDLVEQMEEKKQTCQKNR